MGALKSLKGGFEVSLPCVLLDFSTFAPRRTTYCLCPFSITVRASSGHFGILTADLLGYGDDVFLTLRSLDGHRPSVDSISSPISFS